MEKVVKCNRCGQYFMHTEKNTKCPFPFCKTEHVEVDPVRSREGSSRTKQDAEQVRGFVWDSQRASASNGVEEKPKEKKEATKTQKKSFKIWGKNN